MSSLEISGLAFAVVLGSALLGAAIRSALPTHHLKDESKDLLKLALGFIGTLIALVLGMLIASSKTYYDTQAAEVNQIAAQIMLLDRTLAHYGPETLPARAGLRKMVGQAVERTWAGRRSGEPALGAPAYESEAVYETLQQLSPRNEAQTFFRAQALNLVTALAQTRWLMYEQAVNKMPSALLFMLVFWLGAVFVGFGLLAPSHATTAATVLLCAISVAGAILVMLEMYDPYHGLIQISRAPIEVMLTHLGQ